MNSGTLHITYALTHTSLLQDISSIQDPWIVQRGLPSQFFHIFTNRETTGSIDGSESLFSSFPRLFWAYEVSLLSLCLLMGLLFLAYGANSSRRQKLQINTIQPIKSVLCRNWYVIFKFRCENFFCRFVKKKIKGPNKWITCLAFSYVLNVLVSSAADSQSDFVSIMGPKLSFLHLTVAAQGTRTHGRSHMTGIKWVVGKYMEWNRRKIDTRESRAKPETDTNAELHASTWVIDYPIIGLSKHTYYSFSNKCRIQLWQYGNFFLIHQQLINDEAWKNFAHGILGEDVKMVILQEAGVRNCKKHKILRNENGGRFLKILNVSPKPCLLDSPLVLSVHTKNIEYNTYRKTNHKAILTLITKKTKYAFLFSLFFIPFSFQCTVFTKTLYSMSNFKPFQLPLISILLFTSTLTQNSSVFASGFVNRHDPLRHLKSYKGGYDIQNKHYWASTAFTGVHGYAMAGIWIVFGVCFGSYVMVKRYKSGFDSFLDHPSSYYIACFAFIAMFTSIAIYIANLVFVTINLAVLVAGCGVHGYAMAGIWIVFGVCFGSYVMVKRYKSGFDPFLDHPTSYYIACFALIAMFTSIAIIFSSLILVANQSSLHKTKNLMDTVLGAANNMQQTIETVIQGLLKIQTLLHPYDIQTYDLLNQITNQMRKETVSIQSFVKEARHASTRAMKAVLIFPPVVLLLHWHPGFIILIVACWILTTVSWILTGFDFFFHTFAGDTCTAFEDFEQNQNTENNGIMSIMSSCSNSSTSEKFMAQIGYTVHKYIAESNSQITLLAHKMVQPTAQSDNSFVIERICDPFSGPPSYSYAPGNCQQNALQIHDLPSILPTLTCKKDTPTDICQTEGRFFPESPYGKTMAYIQSVDNLIATYPDLQSLAGCTPIKHAISDVALHQCKPFRASVRLLWLTKRRANIFLLAQSFPSDVNKVCKDSLEIQKPNLTVKSQDFNCLIEVHVHNIKFLKTSIQLYKDLS
ncbi:hypothetical protein CTI12_AA141690 [Artemisia annua]|uniref:Uncharacterized protein n=1 Tax=Artemisia annua TaxID=35608 RepID=A0A2U1PKI9_ARTAN|nr:hypothetical protein CTI12_AA141690 [Artemisia annua]